MKLPRFTLRELFWIVLVAAILCAWWLNRHAARLAVIRADSKTLKQIEAAYQQQAAKLQDSKDRVFTLELEKANKGY